MKSLPGTGRSLARPIGTRGSSAASSSRISACSGSVSWNSSTKIRVNFRCRWPRTASLVADQIARPRQQIGEIERAGGRLQLPGTAPSRRRSSCCRHGREIGVGVAAELLQLGEERVARGRAPRCASRRLPYL